MMSPFKCRMYARVCRAIAHEATTEEGRGEALNMAAIWEDLARDHERADRRYEAEATSGPKATAQ